MHIIFFIRILDAGTKTLIKNSFTNCIYDVIWIQGANKNYTYGVCRLCFDGFGVQCNFNDDENWVLLNHFPVNTTFVSTYDATLFLLYFF